jgi:hypothetical protein
VDIGPLKRVIEVEPISLPVPEELPEPERVPEAEPAEPASRSEAVVLIDRAS